MKHFVKGESNEFFIETHAKATTGKKLRVWIDEKAGTCECIHNINGVSFYNINPDGTTYSRSYISKRDVISLYNEMQRLENQEPFVDVPYNELPW